MEVTDWDQSVRYLYGLQRLPPSKHNENERYPDDKVTSELKTVAVRLYNHQKMTPLFASKGTNGSNNTLAFIVCSSYRNATPSSSPERQGRPRLQLCKPLPLAQWDRLYYTLCAEIRCMYDTLQEQFGHRFEGGRTILHWAGPDGISGSARFPISAVRLALILEEAFAIVTDQRIEKALKAALNGDLVNTDHLHPADIMKMVWDKHDSIARGRSDDETLLARCRAEILESTPVSRNYSDDTHRSSATTTTTTTCTCICNDSCHCRDLCNLQANECECAYLRQQIAEMVDNQESVYKKKVQQQGSAAGAGPANYNDLPKNMFGAPTNDFAQLHVAAMPEPAPLAVQAARAALEASDQSGRQTPYRQRQRTNTENSDLAYVPPPRTPTRGGKKEKDAYPLGLYGDSPGQRYPRFRGGPVTTTAAAPVVDGPTTPIFSTPPATFNNASPDELDSAFYNAQIPRRKPVPRNTSKKAENTATGEQSQIVTYPAIPHSESRNLFTQSFPAPSQGNPRGIYDEEATTADYTALAQEAHDTVRPWDVSENTEPEEDFYTPVDRHPAARPQTSGPVRPHIHQAATTANIHQLAPPKTRHTAPSIGSTPNLRLLKDKDLPAPPPLPDPDFIRPKPASRQRYVSAGGDTPLSERDEIAGPAMPANVKPGIDQNSIPKEELFERLADPEVVRKVFGDEAAERVRAGMVMTPTPATASRRNTSDEEGGSAGSSPRRSGASRISGGSFSRTRVDSAVRERGESFGARIRRVFSRNNSQSQSDATR